MKAYHIIGPHGLKALQKVDIDEPTLGARDVLVEMTAWSLNFRDLSMPRGGYIRNDKAATNPPLIPLSDGVGNVVAIGNEVTRWRIGDRVTPIFFQKWLSGSLTDAQISSALGGAVDGVLAERCAFDEEALVDVPSYLTDEQAATLPCAAVTAWQALTLASPQPGQTILTLGTGGVSIFALQLAKLFGMQVISTSSSDEKLDAARKLGADQTINYRQTPDWDKKVLELTHGQGVDHVIEVGGAGTLERSLTAARVSGRVSLIGILSGQPEQNPSPMMALFKRLTIQGIYVGSRDMFEAMNCALQAHRLIPVIDRSFGFSEVHDAYQHLRSGAHFGKVTIVRDA